MTVTKQQFDRARNRAREVGDRAGRVTIAKYDSDTRSVVMDLDTGIRVSIPVRLVEGLRGASVGDLSEIELSPSGLGLHWPRLDADLYVPAAIIGFLGSERWMAAFARNMGSRGGSVRSAAKAAAARSNGRKGGRPSTKKRA